MYKKSFSVRFLPLAAAIVLVACSKPAPVEEPVRAVKVLTVGMGSMQSGAEFAGEVRARVESRLGFRVGGKITQRPVEVGQRVKAGQLLAQLDPQDFRLAAEAAKAQVAQAATNRNLAAADYKRFKELKDQNFISGAEVERREATLNAAQAQLEQAQAQLSGQRNQAAYTNLLADVSGVVTAVEAERGQVVAAGTPVVRIAQDGPRDIVFSVPEDRVSMIKEGSGVDVRAWSAGENLKGMVREVAASADPVTRTYQVKVSLDVANPKDAPPLGSTVYVSPQAFARSGVAVIKLPTSAFKQDGKTSAVWVLDPATMTVRSQPVEIATADGNDVVVSAGLTPGMLVVSAGVHVLTPGQKVSIYKEKEGDKVAVSPATAASSATGSVATGTVVQAPASAAK
ncbi:efflux RND transporter periplasmic adaptor subunit [Rhodoferax sp.]|uniref:efflux RND transporter periplasmic adaptor subunit n=1 Tax=Rhodoferax sp. TaxID=50421 RepID=UPI001EB624F2|nr:efflux RND transporter periplasmic adaptor subunit [Rhodoferax sp.]MBT9507558.1 efflux RND transporter periplasmic adaptor subunit [Rhodoferax sp.]